MLDKFLPKRIDNKYRGHKLALWLFAVVVVVKILQSVSVLSDAYSIAMYADGIPLDTYPRAAAQTVVAIFAVASLYRLLICVVCVLVLVRYRSIVTFMLALLAVEYLGREFIFHFVPLVRTGTPPGPVVNLVLFALTVVGLALSLWSRGNRKTQA